jgi:hypothetical protein
MIMYIISDVGFKLVCQTRPKGFKTDFHLCADDDKPTTTTTVSVDIVC